jgi:methylmalonyl-CoA mutase N-terminal domain/subunit
LQFHLVLRGETVYIPKKNQGGKDLFREESLMELAKKKLAWEEETEKKISSRPERHNSFYTGSNIEVDRLYSALDMRDFD